MFNFMWNDDKRELELKLATNSVEKFFDDIRINVKTKKLANGVKLTYRLGQHRLARDIMTAIRDNQVLLIQAGVGMGKSISYLVPILYTLKESKEFNRVVIGTSNIVLQQQLLTDINFISNLIGIEIKAVIAKGINNYVCLRRLEELIHSTNNTDKEQLLKLIKEIEAKKTIDKDELSKVSNDIWDQIKLKNRGKCSNCTYSRNCLYRNITKDILNANIVVTNHGNFVRCIIDDREYIQTADMFVFDEAHKLKNAIQGIDEGTLNLGIIRHNINYYIENNILNSNTSVKNAIDLLKEVDNLFSNIRSKTSYYFNKNTQIDRDIKITDCDKLPLKVIGLKDNIQSIIKKLEKLIKDANKMGYYKDRYRITYLEEYLEIFKDLAKGNDSQYIYWVNYYRNNKIHIGYVSKSNINITQNIFGKGIPILCISGTMLDANGSYNYFKQGLSLDKVDFDNNQSVVDGRIFPSPYDYENNTLFYYDTNIANPNDYNQYITDLASKVSELIRATNGRTLVLFTAKSTMETVYHIVTQANYDFNIFLQGTMSDSQICKKFESDVKSCLFATGSFWEGIDISGKSLCNVIITRLPFDNVDAITEDMASKFSKKEAFKMVYLNNMAQKLAQGMGRLIRKKNDKGIICCLDSRCENYISVIKRCTPYCNFTNDIQDVYEFSKKYITNRDGKRKIKKLQ